MNKQRRVQVSIKFIGVAVLLLPFLSLAKVEKVCLGDTYEKVKKLKGFPKQVKFVKTMVKSAADSSQQHFEAVTFHNDNIIHIFDSSNKRLCKLVDNDLDNQSLSCSDGYHKRNCT